MNDSEMWQNYEDETELSEEEIAESLDNQPDFVPERLADCICDDTTYEIYGCMCRRRISPG